MISGDTVRITKLSGVLIVVIINLFKMKKKKPARKASINELRTVARKLLEFNVTQTERVVQNLGTATSMRTPYVDDLLAQSLAAVGTPKDEESLSSDAEGSKLSMTLWRKKAKKRNQTLLNAIGPCERRRGDRLIWADEQRGDEGGGATIDLYMCPVL